MATAQPLNGNNIQPHLVSAKAQIIPIKTGFMGEQGTGKTTTAGLLAAALSKQFHGGAPIHVTDPELGWQFLDPVIFQAEKIKLVQRTIPTFKAMLADLAFAEREGACVWAVEIAKPWIEIVRALQKAKPDNWGLELNYMWSDFVAHFLNAKPHCLVLGRIQDIVEQVLTESGKMQSIKTGEGMKAGGQRNNFGYEPHLVIRMFREQRPRVRKGKTFEEEGRVVHRATVTKDRTWALNGKVFRWPDRDSYRAGDFKYVWDDLKPHFAAVQKTMAFVTLDTVASSDEMLDSNGDSEYYRNRQRKEAISAEIKACLDLSFGGRGKDDVQVRLAVTDLIFGVKSKEAADALPLNQLERGLRILHAYESLAAHDMTSKETVLIQMHDCIAEYDRGESEHWEVPF
ncbi:MAG TPA: ATP-binding protein [Candidatus Sulfotelmatobacter sp.]|nr:ATP-binding protein [Candidatus Sulfotelmatobacter sp.]